MLVMENSLLHGFIEFFVPTILKDVRKADARFKQSRERHKNVSSTKICASDVKESVEKALNEFKDELKNGH